MGGFFAGLGSAVGGAGQAAIPIGLELSRNQQQERERQLTEWSVRQQQYTQLIDKALDSAATPERRFDLMKLRANVLGARPGDDPAKTAKLVQDIVSHTTVHPTTADAMGGQAKPPGPIDNLAPPLQSKVAQASPAAATPPASPFAGLIAPDFSGQASRASDTASRAPADMSAPAPPSPPAATPALSPVQPQSQGQGGASGAITPMPNGQPAGPAPIGGLGGTDPASLQAYIHGLFPGDDIPPAMRSLLEAAMSQHFANAAELERQRALSQYRLSAIEPYLGDVHPELANMMRIGALTGQPMMGGMMSTMFAAPTRIPIDVSGMTPEEQLTAGVPENLIGKGYSKFTQLRDRFGNITGAEPGWAGTVETTGANGQVGLVDRNNPNAAPIPLQAPGGGPAMTHSFVGPRLFTNGQGGQFLQSPAGAMSGGAGVPVPGAVNPSFVPSTTNSLKSVTTIDPVTHQQVTELVPVQSTRTKGGAGAAAAGTGAGGAAGATGATSPSGGGGAASNRSFPKGLTPEQFLKASQQVGQYDQAIDRAQSIIQRLPMLNSMLAAQKINLQLDHDASGSLINLKKLVNRAVPMSQEEEQLAADFRTMMEDVNLLRIPLGAAGFRGPEGWAALQGMRGDVLGRPGITAKVLTNTLQALRKQRDPLAKALGIQPGQSGQGAADMSQYVRTAVGAGGHTIGQKSDGGWYDVNTGQRIQ